MSLTARCFCLPVMRGNDPFALRSMGGILFKSNMKWNNANAVTHHHGKQENDLSRVMCDGVFLYVRHISLRPFLCICSFRLTYSECRRLAKRGGVQLFTGGYLNDFPEFRKIYKRRRRKPCEQRKGGASIQSTLLIVRIFMPNVRIQLLVYTISQQMSSRHQQAFYDISYCDFKYFNV